ncbi:hypothetical protein [Roseburia sp. 499]|uniref:hypothetical protein n=1 Tax=Roseburia sp. 499 TaxID=1261634 RepID=UPI0009535AA7|nr:hypothetical protein [Roseburia sp. 499]WVK68755.1 hypothetical protein BIV20_10220 [Roseburia sp. 499]
MKYMNMKKKYQTLDLQLFAEDSGDDGADGDDSGEGDDQDDDESDEDGEEEKKFSQKDVDEAIKKRIARERRKWQREQQKKTGSEEEPGDDGKKEDKEKQEAISKASQLEVKVACYEADVAKDAVDDVAALARSYMATDEDLDLEDAIEKVVKKYPQFKKGAQDPYEEEEEPRKAWGERQKGKGKKTSGVEDAFLRKNPGIKID